MTDANLQEIMTKVSAGIATSEDYSILAEAVDRDGSGSLAERIHALLSESEEEKNFDRKKWTRVAEDILTADRLNKAAGRPVRRVRIFRGISWAAAAAVLIGFTVYFLVAPEKGNRPAETVSAADIAPGKTGAVLTLSDNSQLALDSLENGIIPVQQGSRIVLHKGRLAYESGEDYKGEAVYNKITTPRGRQFQVTLPDGTEVWLNAASSIRYPTAFTGGERRVEVTGEAFFEVAKDVIRPFKVEVNGKAEIFVLGTDFNINAYENEPFINTTLVNGSVRVKIFSGNRREVVLKPGQQAVIGNETRGGVDVGSADTDKATAWRRGLFNFENATLEEAMKQLERWYDIDVVYEGPPPAIRFVGEIQKNISLKDVLDILTKTKVHFRMEDGRRLIVTQ